MNCPVCSDLGMLVQEWTDAPHDFAICLCPAAQWYRSNINAGRKTCAFGWQVWCAVHQVEPSQVFKLESIYSASELASVGLTAHVPAVSREAALLAAGNKNRRPRL